MPKEFLEKRQRPFSLPSGPWIAAQRWNYMLLAHWPVHADDLRPYVPSVFSLDLFENKSWISFVSFWAQKTRLHGFPRVPVYHSYLELNIRTYITYRGVPGIYFFSLDADKWPVVFGGKAAAFLPYYHAEMNAAVQNNTVYFQSQRQHPGEPSVIFKAAYSPASSIFLPKAQSLDEWLLERYCFWVQKKTGVFRGDIHHDRWRVTQANSRMNVQGTGFLPQSIFEKPPVCHISHEKDVFIWPLQKEK